MHRGILLPLALAVVLPLTARESNHLAPAAATHAENIAPQQTDAVPPRPEGSIYMGGFRTPKIENVRVAMIGLGERGLPQTIQMTAVPHCEVVAVCDLYDDLATKTADIVEKAGSKRPAVYSGDKDAYLRMLEEVKPDAVIISTNWETHAQIAIDAMEHGAHAFVEVPLAITIKDLWRVVDTAEHTKKHCMMLENVNYGRDELMFLNMVRQGLIGELLHGEAAYIHPLKEQMHSVARGCGSWRTFHYAARNGNLYPTHGLGPVAQYMNLARGEDTFDRIVSFSSPAKGRADYAKKNFPADHQWNQLDYQCGDISSSLIKTKLGRTIMVQWDETSPRPYDRKNLIQGTEGTLAGFPTRIAGTKVSPKPKQEAKPGQPGGAEIAESDGFHRWYQGKDAEKEMHAKWDHPLYTRLAKLAEEHGGHGGMDYIMLYRAIECLHKGEPMDQNVYEGALWSAVSPLSEKSVHEGGAPQIFPDFTRGDWKTTEPLGIVD